MQSLRSNPADNRFGSKSQKKGDNTSLNGSRSENGSNSLRRAEALPVSTAGVFLA